MADNNSHGNTRQVGKGMIIVAWVLVLGLLIMFFNQMLSKQRNPNQNISSNLSSSNNVRSVVLKRNRFGHYVATGLINDFPFELLLDTGATDVSVPARLAKKLNLIKGVPVKTITANGTITTYATVLDKVQLGDIVLHNVRASLNPYSDDVLLGMSFLKQLEFTQQGDTLTIKQYL